MMKFLFYTLKHSDYHRVSLTLNQTLLLRYCSCNMTAYCKIGGLFIYILFFLVQHGIGEECTQIKKHGQYSCEGRNLTYIPTSLPSSVKILDFSFNFLPTLKRSVFPQLNDLQHLDLTRCHIHHIADDAFLNMKNLTTLILTGNPVSYFGPDSLNVLHKLHRLVLMDSGLYSLNIRFNNLTKLQELNIGTNNIQSMALPPFMIHFEDFNLLDLHANNISILKVSDTNILQQMKGNLTLILSRNPILHIEPGAFQNMYLRELNIRNAFASLDAQRDGLKALSGLNVGKLVIGNYIENFMLKTSDGDLNGLCLINFEEIDSLCAGWSASELQCIVNATKISIERGNVRAIENVPFQGVKELRIVANIPVSLELSHLETLETLVAIQTNYIYIVGISDMPRLQHIDLSQNRVHITDCCENYFKRMPNIRSLNLSNNGNIYLSNNPFSGLSSLEVLDFHQTTLKGLATKFELFKKLQNLKYLDISYTDFTFWSTVSFGSLNRLKVLKMAGNHFQEDALSYLFENLTSVEYIDISNCEIDSIAWRTFKDLPRLQQLLLNQNRLMVLDFVTHPNLKDLRLLEVHTNNIASIPLNILQNLPKNLTVLDLSFNPIDCSCSQINFILWITSHQQIFPKKNNILCKSQSLGSRHKTIDFDVESCERIRRFTIVTSICAVVLLVLASFLAYRFQFYLRYGYILLKGYRTSRQQEWSYDAFVIYSSKDECWVMDELVENLENGIPPIHLCLHVRDFEAGKAITSNIIDEGIMGSRKIIVVVSKHFTDSSWCRFEFEVAQSWLVTQGNPNIIIIILEDVEEEKTKKVFGLHKHLKKNTYLKWSSNPINNTRFWIRLRKAVIT
ncbi:toll-like receptor 4 [Astyanax mexicanus]|uniref:Toll-like receptor 4 n=1 Tax=Astyanax mexicanus TaxID=7994 RepID=A0A8T2M0X4_ASTMX|nr:toll-like receptor 4 [Astyanax mexicanus]